MIGKPSTAFDRKSVSIIIVNWNGRSHLERSLSALETQTLRPDEIIVVDNASSDDSVDYVKREHPGVRLIALNDNLGFTGGNQAGYEAASGEYIVLLNNDTKPLPDWLQHLQLCADRHPDVGIVASHLTDWDGNVTDTAGDGCSVTGRGYKRHRNRSLTTPLSSEYVFGACAGAALYKRAMLEDVGFFDKRFFMNGEDTDLALRAQLKGWESYFCSEAVVRHRIGASQGVDSPASVYYGARNHIISLVKCMPTRLIIAYAPVLVAETLKLWGGFVAVGRGRAYVRGVLDGLRYLRELAAERRTIRNDRRISVSELERKLSWPRPLAPLRPVRNRFRSTLRPCRPSLAAVTASDVCAVIVTFFPDAGIVDRIERISAQVGHVIVVDNGSTCETLAPLAPLIETGTVELCRSAGNLGVANALNRGMEAAGAHGYRWVLTLDQDSMPALDMVRQMCRSFAAYPRPHFVALVSPNIALPALPEARRNWRWIKPHGRLPTLFERVSCCDGDRDDISFTISSGSLLNLDVFRRIGKFDEGYFIDYVDTEYCLRARAAGYRILLSAGATLEHHLGKMREVTAVGINLRARNHDATRLYYQYRNRLPTLARYGFVFPHWLLYETLASLYNLVRIVFFETDRTAKLRACAQGTWHGVTGRMGKR